MKKFVDWLKQIPLNPKRVFKVFVGIAIGMGWLSFALVWAAGFFLMLQTAVLVNESGTYYPELLYFLRIFLVMPLGAVNTAICGRLFNRITKDDWFANIWKNVYCKTAIICIMYIGLFWLAVQG